MDVNNTFFHLLFGQADWQPVIDRGVAPPDCDAAWEPADEAITNTELCWDNSREMLALRPTLFRFATPPGDGRLQEQDRRGAARDQYGNWYWIGAQHNDIRFRAAHGQQSETFWSVQNYVQPQKTDTKSSGGFIPQNDATPPIITMRGLAVTTHHYLVVGAWLDGVAGLLLFDLHAGGPPLHILWPAAIDFQPYDFAAAPDGGVWILDRPPSMGAGAAARYWALDRHMRVIVNDQSETEIKAEYWEDFQPKDSSAPRHHPVRHFPTGITLEMSSPLELLHPVAIEGLPDGSVLILNNPPDESYSELRRYCLGQPNSTIIRWDDALAPFQGDPAATNALLGHDIGFVGTASAAALNTSIASNTVNGTLYVADTQGNQAFAFDFTADETTFQLNLQYYYFPMRLFSGKSMVATPDGAYYDLDDSWLPLVKQPRPSFVTQGQGILPRPVPTDSDTNDHLFDGKTPACIWHRLLFDAFIPAGAEIVVESRAADLPDLVAQMPWQAEPACYLRHTGSELPYHQPFPTEAAAQADIGTWELLLQAAKGRYLQLRLSLSGTGRNTPRIRSLRVYYPRFSYLQEYLPPAFSQDASSASFLERFLANMEGMYTTLEGRIAQVQTLFDIDTIPQEYLDWLAERWFGIMLDPAWDEARQRLFLRYAIALFNQRGTAVGLMRMVRLGFDECVDERLFSSQGLSPQHGQYGVRIVEGFNTRSTPALVYGDPTDVTGPLVIAATATWTPEQGSGVLHYRLQQFVADRYADIGALNMAWESSYSEFTAVSLAPILPVNATKAADWRDFLDANLDFPYGDVSAADTDFFRHFLAQRYRHIANLNSAYNSDYAAFNIINLPSENEFPTDGIALNDWIQFVSLAVPIRDHAHRFTIMVPIEAQISMAAAQQKLDLVRRIVEIEKPAHTSFEVKPYWAMFRVGEVRLGIDTLLDVGSRFVALILGQNYLADSYLAAAYPWNVADRFITGREQISQSMEQQL